MPKPRLYLFQPSGWVRFWGLLNNALRAAYDDNVFSISKGVAYSALFSFVPVLTSFFAILSQVRAEAVSRVIARFLFEVVPPGSEDLVEYVLRVRGQRPVYLLVTATVVSIWVASGAMASLMEGFRAAYRLPSARPFLKQRAMAIALVFCSAVPALGASALVIFGNRIETAFIQSVTIDGDALRSWVILLGRVVRFSAAFLATASVTALAYFLGPNRPMRFLQVWPGALLATAMWLVTTLGFAWYARNMAHYNFLYGSIGTFIALLTWLYLVSVIALVGCEFNAERERASLKKF
ncbi:MAG TPA: YihY/virulence factor BrkB family protein [Bryobacteraceae bacterium]|jgi:membrane protein|nr:YihY/virulence factor BrkB family protein [Bryobacteraceae bacterium]